MQANSWAQLHASLKDRNANQASKVVDKKPATKPVQKQVEPEPASGVRRKSRNGVWEISPDIPVTDKLERHDKRGYPYRELAVGESFWIPLNGKARRSFRIQNKIPGRRFSGRTRTEDGVLGVRVWRVK